MEACNIVQEVVIKIIPKEKKVQEGKWLSEETLQNSREKKRSKRQRKKERYTLLNAEFQRIARRGKKAYLSEQCRNRGRQ